MPPAACSGLCNRDLVWAGVFARSTMSSTYSASVIVSVDYCLLLDFFIGKAFSFIRSISI